MGTSSIYHGKNDRKSFVADDYDGDQKSDIFKMLQ